MEESDEQLRTTESDPSHYASEPAGIHSFIPQISPDRLFIPDVVRHKGLKSGNIDKVPIHELTFKCKT